MRIAIALGGAALVATLTARPAWGQMADPAGWRKSQPAPYATYPPGNCPAPGMMPYPGTMPSYPTAPGAMPGMPSAPMPGQPGAAPAQPGTAPAQQAPGQEAAQPAATDFGQAPESGSSGYASAAPTMIGDFLGGATVRTTVFTPVAVSGTTVVRFASRTVSVPVLGRGAFKIQENESPRPLDRVFVNYNYFNNVGFPGSPTFDLHREVVGFEKTFLDGNASVGMRFNVFQTDGAGGLAIPHDDFGDITVITKYALVNDPQTGNVLSGGLAVTVPTGPDIILPDGSRFNDVLLQPYTGFIRNWDRLYAIGFSSLIIPTDSRDVLLSTGSLGLGYRVYQACACNGGWLTSITPTIEGHANIPLTHRGSDWFPIGAPDIFDLTNGVHWGLGQHSWLTTAIVVPLTGPKPYDFEAVAQLNWRF